MDLHWKFGYPLPEKYKNNHTISLSAIHYQPDNSSARAFTQLLLANNFDEVFKATKMLQHPNIDSAFITKNGSFGYNSVGSIPKRDVPEMGSFIKDGNTALYDMKGVLSD
jgi:acyl-homoserine lactone acylase PvdQ